MFENIFFSVKTVLNNKNNHNFNNEEAISVLPNCPANNFIRNLLSRNSKYMPVNQNTDDSFYNKTHMFPRVYAQTTGNKTEWDPVDLAPKEKGAEELDNVIDKFVRVIRVDNFNNTASRTSKKRNDREEIRRRLAMGAEDDYFTRTHSEKPVRKPSLHSRLQGGMNLQICFMNETASDTESPSSDSESCPKLSKSFTFSNTSIGNNYHSRYSSGSHPYNSRPLSVNIKKTRPTSLPLGPRTVIEEEKEIDFFTKQARLQIEARMALAQAKDMAHMQMEIDRQKQKQSPITEIIKNSLQKVGIIFPPEKRRVSRQMLTDMNIAQLQVIVNELHTQIESLNENLVQYLMDRDDLHMSQDSMLVDIEDLTRYLGAKEQTNDQKQNNQPATLLTSSQTKELTQTITTRSHPQNKFLRIASLVKK